MIKNLTKHGNSLAVVIDKPILELLGADAGTRFEVVTDGQSLVLTPVKSASERKTFQAALDGVNRKYGRALKKLAN